MHGSTGEKTSYALKYEDIHNTITFITNYAADVGMPQPEAPRGSDGIPPIYLPLSETKRVFTSATSIHAKAQTCVVSRYRRLKMCG